MKIWMKLFDSTIPNIEKVNNDIQAKKRENPGSPFM